MQARQFLSTAASQHAISHKYFQLNGDRMNINYISEQILWSFGEVRRRSVWYSSTRMRACWSAYGILGEVLKVPHITVTIYNKIYICEAITCGQGRVPQRFKNVSLIFWPSFFIVTAFLQPFLCYLICRLGVTSFIQCIPPTTVRSLRIWFSKRFLKPQEPAVFYWNK